jgi:hypothetical protein
VSRGTALALAAAALALGLLLAGLLAARAWLADDAFERACESLQPGDPLADVYARLGPDGYRPGCGDRAPCQSLEAAGRTWALSCTAEDCSQLWVRGALRCAVDVDPATRRVLEVALAR